METQAWWNCWTLSDELLAGRFFDGAMPMASMPWLRTTKTPWKILELLRNGKHEFSSPFMSIQCEPLKPLKINLHTSELKYTSDTHQIGPIYPHFPYRNVAVALPKSAQKITKNGSRRRATVNLRKTGITARALTYRDGTRWRAKRAHQDLGWKREREYLKMVNAKSIETSMMTTECTTTKSRVVPQYQIFFDNETRFSFAFLCLFGIQVPFL